MIGCEGVQNGATMLEPLQRLDFSLPPFVRASWVSDAARIRWEPMFRRVVDAWHEMKWRSVVEGIREAAVVTETLFSLGAARQRWQAAGLEAHPIEMELATHRHPIAIRDGDSPLHFHIAVASPDAIARLREHWERGNIEELGKLFGYPPCCIEFYRAQCDHGIVDTTWPAAVNGASRALGDRIVEVAGPPQANVLLRWLDIIAVPHQPCSSSCERTVEFGNRLLEFGRTIGFAEEMDMLLEILSWPIEWSALHGIAEVKMPLMKISTATDATPCKYTVRREGTSMPSEGGKGVRFPFQQSSAPVFTESPGFRRGLEQPIPLVVPPIDRFAADNDFRSRADMQERHLPIVELSVQTVGGGAGNILDLGCGNGALLHRLRELLPGTVAYGVEQNENRYRSIADLFDTMADTFIHGDIFAADRIWEDGRRYLLVLVMPERFLKVDPQSAAALREHLRDDCDHVLLYAYPDVLARWDSLQELAVAAGFDPLTSGASACLARVA